MRDGAAPAPNSYPPFEVAGQFPFVQLGVTDSFVRHRNAMSPAEPRSLKVAIAEEPSSTMSEISAALRASPAVHVLDIGAPSSDRRCPDGASTWHCEPTGRVRIMGPRAETSLAQGRLWNPDGSSRFPLVGETYEWASWHHLCCYFEADFVVDPHGLLDPRWIFDRSCPVLPWEIARSVIALHERVSFRVVQPGLGNATCSRTAAREALARAALPKLVELDARLPHLDDHGWSHTQRPTLGVIERFELLLAERDTFLACNLARYEGDDFGLLQRSWDGLTTQATAALDAMAGGIQTIGPLSGRQPSKHPLKFQQEAFLTRVTAFDPSLRSRFQWIQLVSRAVANLRNQVHEGPILHVPNVYNEGPVGVALSRAMAEAFQTDLVPRVANFGFSGSTDYPLLEAWEYCEALVAIVRFILEETASWWLIHEQGKLRWQPRDNTSWLTTCPLPEFVACPPPN